jgi:hypothetical protein
MASKERTAASLQAAVDAFLSSPRLANANTAGPTPASWTGWEVTSELTGYWAR